MIIIIGGELVINGLPERLRLLRIQNHLSQKEVARTLRISPAIISSYESGERTPSLEKLLALSNLYKCSTDYLLGRKPVDGTPCIDAGSLTPTQAHALQAFIYLLNDDPATIE